MIINLSEMSDHSDNTSVGNNSSKQSERQFKHKEVKTIILDYLKNCEAEISDSTRHSIKVLPLSAEELGIAPVALEIIGKNQEVEEGLEEQRKRSQITSAVQQLIEEVGAEKQLVVVKVDTPAVDLDQHFDPEQLQFMKNDIFNSIQSQLGTEFSPEVQEQWGTAFKTMMDIVEAEKHKP